MCVYVEWKKRLDRRNEREKVSVWEKKRMISEKRIYLIKQQEFNFIKWKISSNNLIEIKKEMNGSKREKKEIKRKE